MAEKKRWKSTGKTRVKKSRLDKIKKDTRKIKDGERRRGPNGEMNIYNASTGRWYKAKKVKAESGYGNRSNTSATVSSAMKTPASSRDKNVGLGGTNEKYVSPRSSSGKKDDSPSSRSTKTSKIDRIGIRGPQGVVADVAKSVGATVSELNKKYGPMAGIDKGPRVGDTRTRLVRDSSGKSKRVTLRWDGKKWSRQRGS